MYGSDGTGYNTHTGRYRSRFDGLDAMIESRDFRYTHLGAVDDVHQTGLDLFRKFNGEQGAREYERQGGGRNAAGMMCSNTAYTTNGAVTQAYGFHKPQRTRLLNDFVEIHENVHGLHAARNITDVKTGKEYKHGIMLLEDQMRADGYDTSVLESRRDFHKLRGEKGEAAKEFVANYATFYRMEKLGYGEEALAHHARTYNAPQMREAFEAYQRARGKQPAQAPVTQGEQSLEDRVGAGTAPRAAPVFDPAFAGGMPGIVARGDLRGEREYNLYNLLMEFFQLLRWYMGGYYSQGQAGQSAPRYAGRQQAYAGSYA